MITTNPQICARCYKILPGQDFAWASSVPPEICKCEKPLTEATYGVSSN